MDYTFEWDPTKARSNVQKHKVSFEEAAGIFRDLRALSMYDPDHSDTEDRWVTLGVGSTRRLLVDCHTFGDESEGAVTVRIYSPRRPTSKETRTYEKE